jgi:hypothetical protein
VRLLSIVPLLALLASPALAQEAPQSLPAGWPHIRQEDWHFEGSVHDESWLMFSHPRTTHDGLPAGLFRFEFGVEGYGGYQSSKIFAVADCSAGTLKSWSAIWYDQLNLRDERAHEDVQTSFAPTRRNHVPFLVFRRLCGLPLTL